MAKKPDPPRNFTFSLNVSEFYPVLAPMEVVGMTPGDPNHGETLGFDFDDGTGLRVARARFESESRFSWSLFDGFDRIRILTYSAGVSAIIRLLDRHAFSDFECVFGCENTLSTLRDIMAFQQVTIGDTQAAVRNLPDDRHAFILSRVREGQARFRVLCKQIAHAKLYLLENTVSGWTRAVIGSANLSETAFGGRQSETLVCFEDDTAAWDHYKGMSWLSGTRHPTRFISENRLHPVE